MKRSATTIFASCIGAVILFTSVYQMVVKPEKEIHTRIGTGGEQGHYYKIGQILKRDAPNLEVLTTNGSIDNLERLRRGEIDFALIQSGIPTADNVVSIATVDEQFVHIFVPEDSPYQSLRDVQQYQIVTDDLVPEHTLPMIIDNRIPIGIGQNGSGTAFLGTRVFEYFPMKTDSRDLEDRTVKQDDPLYWLRNAKSHEVIFTVYSLHAPIVERMLAAQDYRLLPVHINESIAQAIPGCYPATLPPGLYGTHRTIPTESLPTLKVKTLLVTRKGVSDRKVKHVLRTLYQSKHPELVELKEKDGAQTFGIPLHRSAQDYYQRNEPVSSDKFEIGGVILAVVIFLGSLVGFATDRIHSWKLDRQRKRIQPYFEKLHELSAQIDTIDTIEELEEVMTEMMKIQGYAEKPWLEGDLDTEHMENLYAVASARSRHAETKLKLLIHRNTQT